MTDVSLSAASRETVTLLQRTADLRQQTTRRLATGLRVSQATDDAPAFYQSAGLRARVRDLLAAKENVGQAVSAVEVSLAGLDAIEDLSNQLKGLALAARGGSDIERQAAAEQFDLLRGQITSLANDAGFGGVNLIGTNAASLDVTLNETGSSALSINGQASDAAALGIGTAAASFNSFAADSDIDAAVAQLDGVISAVRARAGGLGSNVATLQVRESFIEDLTNTLDAGAAKLVDADLNAEGARLLSNQLRSELGVESLRVVSQSEQLVSSLL